MKIKWPVDAVMGLGWRQQYFRTAIDLFKPQSYCEIGCHTGRAATVTTDYCLQYTSNFYFAGYDLFELATDETHKQDINDVKSSTLFCNKGKVSYGFIDHPIWFTFEMTNLMDTPSD